MTLLVLLIGWVVPDNVLSQNIHLSASVDKNQLSINDTIELSLTIHGLRKPQKPKLPDLSNFKIRALGTQSSTQIFNSEMRVLVTHKYLLIPKNIGQFVIGSATLNESGNIYKSDPITVNIIKSNSKDVKVSNDIDTFSNIHTLIQVKPRVFIHMIFSDKGRT